MVGTTKELYTNRYITTDATNGQYTRWEDFWRYMDLNHLLILYRDTVKVFNVFAWKYQTRDIYPRKSTAPYQTVEDYVQSFVQEIVAMSAKEPRLTIQGKLGIQLRFQYRC